MNRLRTHLIASHMLVVLVTLVVISLLLVLLLRAQPVPAETILARISITARASAALMRGNVPLLFTLLNNRPEELASFLDTIAANQNLRLILADIDGVIHYDSEGTLPVGTQTEFQILSNAAQNPPQGEPVRPEELTTGRFWQNGEEWLFAGQVLSGQRLGQRVELILVVAAPRPQNSWTEVLDTFGASLLMPVLEAGVVGLVVAMVAVLLTNRGIVGALARLRNATEAVAAGDLAHRVPAQGPDELRDVAVAFNHMAEQVQITQQTQQDFLANV
ncbi:MAG: HAMP domain-containing protein, partial [Anaerolineae bacterium]|nr:HAMP domain-containing protein [Anaerolineae bacterium]